MSKAHALTQTIRATAESDDWNGDSTPEIDALIVGVFTETKATDDPWELLDWIEAIRSALNDTGFDPRDDLFVVLFRDMALRFAKLTASIYGLD